MKFLADLHIHSHFSIATSKDCDPEHLFMWACLKGITLVGTGDFTHPGWREELGQKLIPAEEGLYRLRPEHEQDILAQLPKCCHADIRFILSSEISSIYKRGGKTRKVHNCILVPSFKDAEGISDRLDEIGNIKADGRPILGLDSHDLLEIMLEKAPDGIFIPAHIWTPHFSLFGAYSGFDTVEECFGDLSSHILALETGLSSDPPMNWRLSALDKYTLVSNSDAHSPRNLAREANLFDCTLSFSVIRSALKDKGNGLFLGTVEFFPEEGKYHYNGHRNCGIRLTPEETRELNGICPKCGKQLTLGVMHRVVELADRPSGFVPEGVLSFKSIIPLPEIIADYKGCGKNTRKVEESYFGLLQQFGPEWKILTQIPIDELERYTGAALANGIRRIREAKVEIKPGFDGQYGTITLFTEEERRGYRTQISLFSKRPESSKADGGEEEGGTKIFSGKPIKQLSLFAERAGEEILIPKAHPRPPLVVDYIKDEITIDINDRKVTPLPQNGDGEMKSEPGLLSSKKTHGESYKKQHGALSEGLQEVSPLSKLNPGQMKAVISSGGPALVIAGPGTGKTMTLVSRIAYLINERGIAAERILTITFTNKAAKEVRERIEKILPNNGTSPFIGTFHHLCLWLLKQFDPNPGFILFHTYDSLGLVEHLLKDKGFRVDKNPRDCLQAISRLKVREGNGADTEINAQSIYPLYEAYQRGLLRYNAYDFDDLLIKAVELLKKDADAVRSMKDRFRHILVDEFQDLNLIQFQLVKLLATGEGDGLFVIGDPNQAIYGFRGANNTLFYKLQKTFEGAQLHNLEINYRSTPQIIKSALSMISENPQPLSISLNLKSVRGDGPLIKLVESASEKMEAIAIVKEITALVGGIDMLQAHGETDRKPGKGGNRYNDSPVQSQKMAYNKNTAMQTESVRGEYTFSDFAILYRTASQADILEECLLKEGIPYRISGQQGIMERPLVRQMLALLKWCCNPSDEHALIISLGLPLFPKTKGLTSRIIDLMIYGKGEDVNIEPDTKKTLGILKGYRENIQKTTPSDFIGAIIEDMKDIPLKKGDEKEIKKVLLLAGEFENIQEIIQGVSLYREADISWRGKRNAMATEMVSLSTIHAAKGLEFPVVFICGCEDGLIPYRHMTGSSIPGHVRNEDDPPLPCPDNQIPHAIHVTSSGDNPSEAKQELIPANVDRADETTDLEEERRLLYVGITRAKERLYLSWSKNRRIYGKRGKRELSPFIKDIPSDALQKTSIAPPHPPKPKIKQLSLW